MNALKRALAGGVVAMATLAIATPAFASTAPPKFSLTMSPAAVSGPQHSIGTFVFKDTGASPIKLAMDAQEMRPVAGQPNVWTPWQRFDAAQFSVKSFYLNPGQSQSVSVTIRSTDGLTHRLSVIARVVPPDAKSGAYVSSAIGAKYVITGKPNAYAAKPVTLPAPPSSGGGLSMPLTAAGAAGILAIVAGIALELRRRYNRRPNGVLLDRTNHETI